MIAPRLLKLLLMALPISWVAAAEQAVGLFPGESADPRRAARIAHELQIETAAPPALSPGGWLTRIPLPPSPDITRLPMPDENGEYVCITPHYRITCSRRPEEATLRRVADIFEATYAANLAVASKLPVLRMRRGAEQPPVMHVRLVPTMEEYHRLGGVRGSSGVYQSSRLIEADSGIAPENQPCTAQTLKQDTVLVSFPAIGLNADGTLNEHPVNTHLLVHEGTHQCFIFNNLPIWANEGWAEYIGSSPHVDGMIDFEKGFALISARARRSASAGRLNCPFSLEEFFTMSKSRMYELGLHSTADADTYALSAMTVAFFLHMDGTRGVEAMRQYLRARIDCVPNERALALLSAPYGGMAALQRAFVDAWKSRHIRLQMKEQR
ncbi:MAG: hypothetical protein IJ498_02245 [Akkermansia sp.]|nr:hypothetical protein [Akkermansia sp.]